MTRRWMAMLVVGIVLLSLTSGEARADGFIVIDRPMPIVPPMPRPPRPPVRDVPLAVRNHQVTCDITDGVAVTRIDQVFYNPNAHQVEGTYIFPLDDDIALSGFSMFVNGRELKGEVLDRDKARQVYESIVARMRDPALLEYVGTRMYKARIFPIPASGSVRVKLEYAQVLGIDNGLVRYRYPLNTEKFSSQPLEQVSVLVNVSSKKPIKSVFCPTHNMAVVRHSDSKATASYEDRNVKPDQDLVFYYSLSDEEFGLSLLTYNEPGQDGFFIARIAPKAQVSASEVVPKDICFIADTSGSMAGAKIEQTRKALLYCLNKLNPQDRFQFVLFSHETRNLAEELVPATAENIKRAVAFIEQIQAEGGTNINDAILDGLKSRPSGEGHRPYLMVFLTDGQPTIGETNAQKILSNVAGANAGSVRLFVFGVGDDVNTQLLDKLAEQNHGARDYIGDKENLEIKVSSFYRKVADPVLANLELHFPKLGVHDVFPKRLPDLFAGSEVVVVGRYSQSGNRAVELLGQRRSTKERFVYETNFAEHSTEHAFLPQLWAMRKVGFLLDEIRLHGESKELVEAVAKLSIEYGIVTPYTAYLVHEQQRLTGGRTRGGQALDQLMQRAERRGSEMKRPAPARLLLKRGSFRGSRSAPSGSVQISDSKSALSLQQANAPNVAIGGALADLFEEEIAPGRMEQPIRRVAGRTLYYQSGQWVDSSIEEGAPSQKIIVYSQAYFELARRDRRAAQILAQGPRVVFFLDGTIYETTVSE